MQDLTTSINSSTPICEPTAQHQVVLWLVEGNNEHDIRQAIAQKFPGLCADTLLHQAMGHFEQLAEADNRVIRGWCLEAYREMYRRMVEIGDYNNAMKAVKALHQLAS